SLGRRESEFFSDRPRKTRLAEDRSRRAAIRISPHDRAEATESHRHVLLPNGRGRARRVLRKIHRAFDCDRVAGDGQAWDERVSGVAESFGKRLNQNNRHWRIEWNYSHRSPPFKPPT